MVPFHISDLSLTFFAQGRPYTIQSDHPNFDHIRKTLLLGDFESADLVALTDIKASITVASNGKLEFDGDGLLYNGTPIHNVWADKILLFRKEGLSFDPIFKALESLYRNPSFAARERLPLFVERSRLGFLPDGRITAFKVIKSNWHDSYTGTFDNSIGKLVEMPRADVDDDWQHTCSPGLHLGALEYIPTYGLYKSDRRVVLCAFWPEDAVAIPKDYDGSKLRVCRYEVMSEVDKKFIADFVESHQTVVAAEDDDDDDDYADDDDYDENSAQFGGL